MSVILSTSNQPPPSDAYDHWIAIADTPATLDEMKAVADIADRLELAYEQALARWCALATIFARDRGADLAHTPACASNASDFGQMLAWTIIVEQAIAAPERFLVLCDDPWMFRHLADHRGVVAGMAPSLWRQTGRLALRGYAARGKVAVAVAIAALRLRGQRKQIPHGAPVLLVYGHPSSNQTYDGYFGDLMTKARSLVRMLHVDCAWPRARALAQDKRTFSLHAWGPLCDILGLPFARWRPVLANYGAPLRWLIRRSAALEGSTGQAAMIAWQKACQTNWLAAMRPRSVAWPWENHAWEKNFVRTSRANGVRTVGYQHATVGRFELNYALACNIDGLSSIPDVLMASGRIGYNELSARGYPAARLHVGGAFRFHLSSGPRYDPQGPVFVALPSDLRVASELVGAIRPVARAGREVLVRGHPMTPFAFTEEVNLKRGAQSLAETGPLSAVIFAGTTVGLEARIAGLPTVRFKPSRTVANDIIPSAIPVPSATSRDLAQALSVAQMPQPIDIGSVFSAPDYDLWTSVLDIGRAA